MPPKKKSRTVASEASTPAEQRDTPQEFAATSSRTIDPRRPDYDPLKDLWTDEQEISLFRAIVQWKPSGVHKHFRMLAISNYLRNHGYDPTVATHTRIPGIWAKLSTLYNLPIIDDRENNPEFLEDGSPDDRFLEFNLADRPITGDKTFAEMMHERRLNTDTDARSSPAQFDADRSPSVITVGGTISRKRKRGAARDRQSTVDDTDDARSSPGTRGSPAPRGGGARGARASKRRVVEAIRAKQDSTDRQQREDTTGNEDEDQEMDIDEDEDEEEEEAGTPSAKPKGGSRAKGAPTKASGATRKGKRKR